MTRQDDPVPEAKPMPLSEHEQRLLDQIAGDSAGFQPFGFYSIKNLGRWPRLEMGWAFGPI